MEKSKALFTNLAYAAIALTVIGQVTVGSIFYVGQSAYLLANIVNIVRDIKLDRPRADKIKDFTFFGITFGLILLKAISG